jgi:hypothetical protein
VKVRGVEWSGGEVSVRRGRRRLARTAGGGEGREDEAGEGRRRERGEGGRGVVCVQGEGILRRK